MNLLFGSVLLGLVTGLLSGFDLVTFLVPLLRGVAFCSCASLSCLYSLFLLYYL